MLGAVILVIGGGIAYAYTQKLGPFARIPYTENNLISGLLLAASKIDSAQYSVAASIAGNPREADAKPFTVQISNYDQLLLQYKEDARRMERVTLILSTLKDRYTYAYLYPKSSKPSSYPSSLQELARTSAYATLSINDPKSGQPFTYRVTEGGKNFELTATFVTPGAITEISKYADGDKTATSTIIKGQTVTFTKDSYTYFYLPSEPPKPFLVQIGEMMRYLPADIRASLSASAAADLTKTDSDWKFNVDATGDLGDLTYKVNVDALRKSGIYYIRVNNLPALLGDLSTIKGKWVKIDPKQTASSSPYSSNEFEYVAAQIPDAESKYKEKRAQFTEMIRTLATFADETHLVAFKGQPRSEKIEGRTLYRYDLRINKDAILPFYKKMLEEAQTNAAFDDLDLLNDPGMVEYLQSPEFSQTFDYYDKNTSLTLWVDALGYPAIVQYDMRIVPPDTATQLKDKQFNSSFRLTLSGINQAVSIATPSDAKPIQDLIKEWGANLNYSLNDGASNGTDAAVMSDLNSIQTQAEIYFTSNKRNSYGTQTLLTGPASSCTGGMYSDAVIKRTLAAADSANGTRKVSCYANTDAYLVGAELSAGGWWCVDSNGESTKEPGTLPSAIPQEKNCP